MTNIINLVKGIKHPLALNGFISLVSKDRIYLLGGTVGHDYTSNIYIAKINDDGSLSEWVLYKNHLPRPLAYSKAIVTSDRLYLVGGVDGNEKIYDVYSTKINDDGSLSEWISETPLPIPLLNSEIAIIEDTIYLLGGIFSNNTTSVILKTKIGKDGKLGEWEFDEKNLPEPISNSQVIVTKNRIYMLGGYSNGDYEDSIFSANIETDGSIGTWIPNGKLPIKFTNLQTIVDDNIVYLLGSYNYNKDSVSSYIAPINADGTLGEWRLSNTKLPVDSIYYTKIHKLK